MKTGNSARELGEQELYKSIMGDDPDEYNETYEYKPTGERTTGRNERCGKCNKLKIYHLAQVIITDKDQWCICDADKGDQDGVEVYFNNPV